MKRALQFKFLSLLFMMPLLVSASVETDYKHDKKKTISKEFTVNKNASLEVNNSYGNIDIITWNENRIVIEVTITTSGNDADKVQKKLDDITVKFSASPERVAAKTIIDGKNSNSWWKWGKNNNVKMSINYTIKLPIANNINLNNDYGNITVDKLEGRAEINCDYGKITTKELMSDNNILNFDYTKNCYFEYIKSGKINADYSDFVVAKAKVLDINADYSNSKIEVAEDINYNCDYGKVTIEKANNISGNADYVTSVIGDVYKTINLNADYGSIKISRLNENAGDVTIKSEYAGITIGLAPTYNFNFIFKLEYASLRDSNGFNFTKKVEESSDKYYSGYYGKQNSGSTMHIVSEYGNLTFNKN
ncbi:hypothetical protein [Changchengzhania lutea]|uniref:hypothetical protein n=1 Tax=Changchengzhania lutea TaxID=2049305 RepID=UPI001FE2D5A1|nr:hypothetical protein [Changchengzhania lutea]